MTSFSTIITQDFSSLLDLELDLVSCLYLTWVPVGGDGGNLLIPLSDVDF